MTNQPDDPIDSYEPRLTRRVASFAEGAVRPIDPLAIAAAARAGARRRTLAGRLFGGASSSGRLGVILVSAALVVGALGLAIGAGGGNLFAPSQTSTADVPEATPTDVPGDIGYCAAGQLTGEIFGWEGAAGHRIASIGLHNLGPNDCALPELLRPALIDADGHALIVGAPVADTARMRFQVGDAASSQVDMSNYCGAAPTSALTIRLYLPDQTSFELSLHLDVPGPVDPPPCNGPTEPASIEMQPVNP